MSAYNYPLLKQVSQLFSSNKANNLEDVYICACQHLLEPQEEMFNLISNFGIPRKNIFIFGKIYSTNNEVLSELKEDGFNVIDLEFDPNISFDEQHQDNCKRIFQEFVNFVKPSSRIIVLDDGGELLKIANEEYELLQKKGIVIGVEQTSSGFRKLENTKMHFPVINVARSSTKLIKESPLIAHLGCTRIVDVFNQYEIKESRILVVGLGPIGSNVFSILNNKGYFIIGHDSAFDSESEIVNLVKDNHINVIVGATGSNIVDEHVLTEINQNLAYKVYLISMSSSDREFPALHIRRQGVIPEKIHSDIFWNNIVLVNNGFPITFKGSRHESTPEEIEKTIALLYGSVLSGMFTDQTYDRGFIDVPSEIIDIIETHD
jgi:hypothetical protein